MTKTQQYFQDMLDMHQDLFKNFKQTHDNYAENAEEWKDKFHEEGKEANLIIQRYINKLCMKMESGKYGKFSSNLADKFWEEVRKYFPKIDEIHNS